MAHLKRSAIVLRSGYRFKASAESAQPQLMQSLQPLGRSAVTYRSETRRRSLAY
jgi:hypothetical protein